jgi:hypothetical protein
MTFEEAKIFCAQAAHEVNRVYCLSMGDTSQVHWEDALTWQRQSALLGVEGVIKGNTPQQSHESWVNVQEADGWKYGPIKDAEKKEHPCMVPYDQLPSDQRVKDELFVSTVKSLWHQLWHYVNRDAIERRYGLY